MTGLLSRILEPGALSAVFQPVFRRRGRTSVAVEYHEALVRGPQGTNLVRPDVLFTYARHKHAELVVDRAALRTVILAGQTLREACLGVNVHLATLASDLEIVSYVGELLAQTGRSPETLVVEIVEHGTAGDPRALQLNLDGLRGVGVRIALDDFGAGEANLQLLLSCRPDYVKLDRWFVHGSHGDPARRAVIRSLVSLAAQLGVQVVGEGVEEAADLEVLESSGIELVQGFLLGRPQPAPGHRGERTE